jgi:hypothetical protein
MIALRGVRCCSEPAHQAARAASGPRERKGSREAPAMLAIAQASIETATTARTRFISGPVKIRPEDAQ